MSLDLLQQVTNYKPLKKGAVEGVCDFKWIPSTISRLLYADEDILKAKIELLNHTNMVDYAMDIHMSLYHTEDVPQDMVDRRIEVVARLKALEESVAPLITFLQNPNAVQELRADKQYNLQMLNERYQIGPGQIEALEHSHQNFINFP